MAERIDRRAARTRRALHNALMALILRKGYDAITVQEIIDEADVGRSTFYAHYTGKENLLRSGFQTLRTELSEALRAAMAEDKKSADEPLPFSLAIFEHAARYQDVERALAGGRGGSVATAEIRRVLSDFVKKDLADTQDDGIIPRQLRVEFIISTFLTVLGWWFERAPRLKPAEVDTMFRRLALDGTELAPAKRRKR